MNEEGKFRVIKIRRGEEKRGKEQEIKERKGGFGWSKREWREQVIEEGIKK